MGLRRTSRGSIDLPEVRYEFGTDGDDPVEPGSAAPARLLIAGVVGGLVALWLVSGLASGGSERTQGAAAATATAPVLVVPSPVPTPLPTPVPTPTPAATSSSDELSFVDARAAQIAWSQLSTAGPAHGVAYNSESGLAVLEFATGLVTVIGPDGVGPGGGADEDLALSFGPGEAGLLARTAMGPLVGRGLEGGVLVRVSEDGSSLVVLHARTGEELGRHPIPPGASLRVIDGYGVTAHVPGEGTFVATPERLVLFTSAELLSSNGRVWIERRCERDCSVVLVDPSGGENGERELPESFSEEGSRYVISPNGVYVLRITAQGAGELYLPDSGGIWWVNGSGIGQAAWAPDSSFVAWIDHTADPLLKLMLPERHDWIVVDLELLGAAPPTDGELRVLVTDP